MCVVYKSNYMISSEEPAKATELRHELVNRQLLPNLSIFDNCSLANSHQCNQPCDKVIKLLIFVIHISINM